MKILIVDDEIHLIQAIRLLIPWEELGIHQILTASSVPEAMEILIKERPELAFFDIVIDRELGTTLMQFVVDKKFTTRVIAISGHSDYKYVRDMLVLGAVDYLIKPLDRQQLLSSVKKAIKSWNEECQKTENSQTMLQQINYLTSEHEHTLLGQLFSPRTAIPAYDELRTLSLSFASSVRCTVLYSDLSFYPQQDPAFLRQFTFFFDTLRTDLEHKKRGTAIRSHWTPDDAIILLYGDTEQALRSVQTSLTRFRCSSQYPLHFGAVSCIQEPSAILHGYHMAKTAYYNQPVTIPEHMPLLSWQKTESSFPLPSNTCSPSKSPPIHSSQSRILSAILMNDRSLLFDNVTDWVSGMLPEKPITFGSIRRLNNNFSILYDQWLSYFKDQYPALDCSPKKTLPPSCLFDSSGIFDLPGTIQTYSQILNQLTSAVGLLSHAHDLIEQIASYMEINYACPFDQGEYARIFHINKDYMCRRFTETYGISMVTRLNQIRVEHAKKLLRSGNEKIIRIAQQIGYNDDKYFTKIFKKLTGLTPNEYRRQNRSSSTDISYS
ncbi:MAG: helix-turn-helix domain-containing protein [Eubacteriales bacterium]|nr:helix-turn-helix domain-containing protein [Eubacteriales bacterium]